MQYSVVNDTHVSSSRMKMRESNVPRSKLQSVSYKRPSLLERLELKEVGRREDNITSNVVSTEKDFLLAEESELVKERVGIFMLVKINKVETANNTASPNENLFFHTYSSSEE